MNEYDARVETLFYKSCRCDEKARKYIFTFVNHYWDHRLEVVDTVTPEFIKTLEHFERVVDDDLNPKASTKKDALNDIFRPYTDTPRGRSNDPDAKPFRL